MKDLYEILREKEMAIERVQKEIAALKFVVPLYLGTKASPGELASLLRPGAKTLNRRAMAKGPCEVCNWPGMPRAGARSIAPFTEGA